MATRATQSKMAKKVATGKAPAAKRAATKSKMSAKSAAAATGQASEEGNQPAKIPKHKLVRDSFTMPRDEYAAIGDLKMRLAKLEQLSKKSELLRAGIKMLASLSDAALLHAVLAVPSIKTGRPNGPSQGQAPDKKISRKNKSAVETGADH